MLHFGVVTVEILQLTNSMVIHYNKRVMSAVIVGNFLAQKKTLV